MLSEINIVTHDCCYTWLVFRGIHLDLAANKHGDDRHFCALQSMPAAQHDEQDNRDLQTSEQRHSTAETAEQQASSRGRATT